VKFPKPLFPGDTIRVETEIKGLRESKSRPTQGIVTFEHRAFNQRDELVCILQRSGLQHKKPIET
jgi:acyl dehydratase